MSKETITGKQPQQRLDIPGEIDREAVLRNFRQESTRPMAARVVDGLIPVAGPVARPRALYRVSCIGERTDDWVEIDGVRFTSRVLSRNLSEIDTVIPYIITCGRELDEIPVDPRDYLRYYCLDLIKMSVLFNATRYFMDFLKEKYGLSEVTHLHPGEFADWPIEEQGPLFSLFDKVEETIGVRLTSTRTLQPIKSGSGILFSNGSSFESCQLCTMANCPGRRVAYSPALAKKFLD